MDQLTFHQAIYLPLLHSAQAATAPKPARTGMLARPGARNLRFGRAAEVLAQAGQRLAVIARRVGQPADTFSGPAPEAPEDIRARYSASIYGVTNTPPSLRDADRRW